MAADTVGRKPLQSCATPGWRISVRRYVQQDETSATGSTVQYVLVSVVLVVLASLFVLYLSGIAVETSGQFSVADLEPGNVTVAEEETVAVSATVENTGETATTQVVTLSFGTAEKRVWLTLAPGERETVPLAGVSGRDIGVGNTTARVRTANDEATATVRVESDRPPTFEVRDLQPGDVATNDSLDVSAVIENTGGKTATQTVALRVGGETVAQRSVTLDPGESQPFAVFNARIAWLGGGDHVYGVYTGNDSARATATVAAPASLALRNSTADNETLHTSDQFTLSGTLVNTGERATNETVSLTVNGTVLDTTAVELAGGEERTVVFRVAADRVGIGRHAYSLSAGDATTGGTLLVEGDEPAHFAVTALDPGDTAVAQPGTLTASATITNTGERAGNRSVELYLWGEPKVSTTMELAPGESRQFAVYNLSLVDYPHAENEYGVVTPDDSETAIIDTTD